MHFHSARVIYIYIYIYIYIICGETGTFSARNADFGLAAAEELKKEGLNPIFHQLDITDVDSIDDLKGHLVQNYGGLDVLVNNAGIGLRVGLFIHENPVYRRLSKPYKHIMCAR